MVVNGISPKPVLPAFGLKCRGDFADIMQKGEGRQARDITCRQNPACGLLSPAAKQSLANQGLENGSNIGRMMRQMVKILLRANCFPPSRSAV